MEWWHWIILGSVLFAAEIFAIEAQFYLVFLGLSAAVVGLLTYVGLGPAWVQWGAFGALALISLVTLRKVLHTKIHGNQPEYKVGVAGEFLTIEKALEAGQTDRVSFRGTDWTVVNQGAAEIGSGSRVEIERSEGLTLYVGTKA